MFTLYNLLKFLHVVGAIAWVGSAFTMTLLYAGIARSQDTKNITLLSRMNTLFGRMVFGPAALLTLLTGMTLVGRFGLGFDTLWISVGLTCVIASILLGAVFIRRTTEALGEVALSPAPNGRSLYALRRRLNILNLANLFILFVAVGAMVFKPVL